MQQFQPVDQISPPPLDPLPADGAEPQVLDYGTLAPPRKSRPGKPPRQPLWPAMGWLRHILVCMGLLSIVLLAFSNSYKAGMTLDNKYIIEEYFKSVTQAQRDLDLKSWQEIALLFENDYWWPKGISGLYRPITTFTYWINYVALVERPPKKDAAGEVVRDAYGQPVLMSWFDYANTPGRKLDTSSYHTINLIVHWLNGVLLYFVSLLLIKRFWPAVLIAALFLAHPITTESVTNIIGRADMFAGVAVFGGLLLYVRSMRNDDSWALPWLFGLMLLTTFGVFSKESSAAVVLVAICYDLVYHWRTGEDGKNGLALLVGRSLLFGLVMVLVPLMTSSWSETVLHPTRFPMAVRVALVLMTLGYGAVQYVLLAFLRPGPREPLLYFGGVLVSAIFASVVLPFYPLVLPILVGLIELTRYWVQLVREDRFAELPRLIGHGILYLTLAGALIGPPVVFSLLANDSEQLAKAPHLLRQIVDALAHLPHAAQYGLAGVLTALGVAIYVVMFRSTRPLRTASLLVLTGAVSIAALGVPYFPLAVAILVLLVELARGSLTSSSERFRVVAHATAYFFLFFFLICLPIGALIQFHRSGLDEWFPTWDLYVKGLSTRIPQWQWYLQGGLALTAGLFLHFATINSERTTRIAALLLVLCTIVVASFCSYFMGILLGVIVAIHELILGTLLPRDDEYRRDWKRIWHGFALGYMVMIPPLLAMMLVRMWVFSNATPAEEPFLDNPIRGIWKVQELGMKSFEEELAKKPLEGMSFPECKMTAVKVLGKCVYLVAWPWTLCSDYSYDEFPNFSWYLYRWEDWKAVFSLFFFIGCGYAAYKLRDRNRAACFFIICFFAAALPTSNLTITIGSVMAERFMYLPLGAFAGVIVLLIYRLARLIYEKIPGEEHMRGSILFSIFSAVGFVAVCVASIHWGANLYITFGCMLGTLIMICITGLYLLTAESSPGQEKQGGVAIPWLQITATVFLASLVVVYGVRAYDRNFVWQDDLHLWTDAIQTSTRSFRCYQSLAFAKYEQDAKNNIDDMINIDEQGIPIVDHLPNHLNSSRLYLHLGMFYVLKGEYLSTPSPDGPVTTPEAAVWFNKARAILEKGVQVDRAFDELNHTKQILRGDKPDTICNAGLEPLYTTLAVAYSKLGMSSIAANRMLYARQLNPTSAEVYEKYGYIISQEQRYEDALLAMVQSILINSTDNPHPWEFMPKLIMKMGPEWQDAVLINGSNIKLNLKHPLIQQLITRAFRDLIAGFLRSRHPAMAMQIRDMAISSGNRYDWVTADSLDSVFEDPIPDVDPDGIHMDRATPGPGRPTKRRALVAAH